MAFLGISNQHWGKNHCKSRKLCFSNKCFVSDRTKAVRHLTLLQVSGEDQLDQPAAEPVPGNKVLIPTEWEITKWRDVNSEGKY